MFIYDLVILMLIYYVLFLYNSYSKYSLVLMNKKVKHFFSKKCLERPKGQTRAFF